MHRLLAVEDAADRAGAPVDPVAYAPLARAAAGAGHEAWIVALPRRGAFGGASARP